MTTQSPNSGRPSSKLGLILSGGGARGAYQAGVLRGIAEIAAELGVDRPFRVVAGVSAGAVNAGYLAAAADNFQTATEHLTKNWQEIEAERVFKTDALTAGRLGVKFALDAAIGALYQKKLARSLLDTSPLWDYLTEKIDFGKISRHLQDGHLDAVALTAMNYTSSHSITFVESARSFTAWDRSRRRSQPAKLGVEHIMASSAIPLFFPPVRVGEDHFGDGSLRNTAPLSPAIHLGAERLIVISVRRPDPITPPNTTGIEPSLARVLGVILNALLMDAIEFDMERLSRINQTVDVIPAETRQRLSLRKVDYLWIRPSVDIGAIATGHYEHLPRVIRYLVSGLGSAREASELTSYLLFNSQFCSELVRVGREDALAQREQLIRFLT